jgi:hypothetical protein
MSATCSARRPSTTPSASMTCHLRWSKSTFGKYVFISKPNKGTWKLSNARLKSTGDFKLIWRSEFFTLPPEPEQGGVAAEEQIRQNDFHGRVSGFCSLPNQTFLIPTKSRIPTPSPTQTIHRQTKMPPTMPMHRRDTPSVFHYQRVL